MFTHYNIKGVKLEKEGSDVKIDIKLSTIKPIHSSWIVAAFQLTRITQSL
jgi:transketolase C-terminal domain/subunit